MQWKPFIDLSGVVHNLDHLHPFFFTVQLTGNEKYSALDVDVYVGFAMHTFTRKGFAGDADAEMYKDDREARIFDHERYIHSKLLPGIVRALPERKCFNAKNQNFLTVASPKGSPPDCEYHVFFVIDYWKAKSKATARPCVLVIVQSAYLSRFGSQVPRGRREQPISFRVLLNRSLGLSPPKKQRAKSEAPPF